MRYNTGLSRELTGKVPCVLYGIMVCIVWWAMQLSLSKTRKSHPVPRTRRRKLSLLRVQKPGVVYRSNLLYPSGIKNPSHNCYANSVLQCLFNSQAFLSVCSQILQHHPGHCSQQCCTSGKQLHMQPYLTGKILYSSSILQLYRSDMQCSSCANDGCQL